MLRRIVVENFMSHARTVLEPADGLTVLVGPNNCGKSAIVSALQTLCSNLTGDYMVRHGERVTSVTVETDDGHSIVWQRKGSTVSYVIDGEEVHRLRGGVPDRVHELLRLPRVRSAENGEDEFDIHFGTQKAPIFLIHESERRAAIFFAASSDAALLLQMQKRHGEKVKDGKRERDKLSSDRTRLDRELHALQPIADLSQQLHRAEQDYQSLESRGAQLARCDAGIRAIAREQTEWSRHGADLLALEPLRPAPEATDTRPLESLSCAIASTREQVDLESVRCHALMPLREAPTAHNVQPLASLAAIICDETENCATLGILTDKLATLLPVPQLLDATAIAGLDGELSRESEINDRANQSCNALVDLRSPPEPVDPTPFQRAIDQLVAAETEVAEHSQLLQQLATQSVTVELEIRQWAQANPICQLCGAPVVAERLLAGEHRHE